MKTSDFIEKQLRASVLFLKIFPIFILLIVGMNIWYDVDRGKRFDWMHIAYGMGFIAFTGVLYVFMRLIFQFVRAKVRHDERRS